MGFFIPVLGIVDSEMKITVSAVKIFRIQLRFWLNAKRKLCLCQTLPFPTSYIKEAVTPRIFTFRSQLRKMRLSEMNFRVPKFSDFKPSDLILISVI